eukprot:c43437_g1_i1 orf=105-281(+)
MVCCFALRQKFVLPDFGASGHLQSILCSSKMYMNDVTIDHHHISLSKSLNFVYCSSIL